MNLSELSNNDKAVIKKLSCGDDLKQRLHSFGVMKNCELTVENISFSKNTMSIEVENTSIALRMEEAKYIEVEKIS